MLSLSKGSGTYFLALNLFVGTALAAKPAQKIPEEALRIDASLNSMKRDTAIVFGLSTEGAHLSAFSVDGSHKKFEVTFYGETGKTEVDYYVNNDTLLFAKEVEYQYTYPIYDAIGKENPIKKTITRYVNPDDALVDREGTRRRYAEELSVFKKALSGSKDVDK